MATSRNSRLLDVSYLGTQAQRAYGNFPKGVFTKRREAEAAKMMRESLRDALRAAMIEAQARGEAPVRTGYGIRQATTSVRAFGTSFADLRGHIVAPIRMVAHEEGATIRARNVKYLAIPILDGLRADGSPKFRSPRQWKHYGSFTYKSKKTGKLFIARKAGEKKDQLQLLYVLKESVKLHRHTGWASRSWERQLPLLWAEWNNIVASFLTVDLVEEAYVRGLGS